MMSGVDETKKGREPGCYEIRADTADMVTVGGEIDTSRTQWGDEYA